METTKVKFKKLNERAIVPTYASEYAAGADLYACMGRELQVRPGKTEFVHTGIVLEIPNGLVGLVYARSGLACKKGLAPANKVGVIDSDYRGEVVVALYNQSEGDVIIEDGERIAQIVITPYRVAEFEQVDELENTIRGAGGFGSTGRRGRND